MVNDFFLINLKSTHKRADIRHGKSPLPNTFKRNKTSPNSFLMVSAIHLLGFGIFGFEEMDLVEGEHIGSPLQENLNYFDEN